MVYGYELKYLDIVGLEIHVTVDSALYCNNHYCSGLEYCYICVDRMFGYSKVVIYIYKYVSVNLYKHTYFFIYSFLFSSFSLS